MSFQIISLPAELFASLSRTDAAVHERRRVHRLFADTPQGYPCRVSLRDADVGDELMLLEYQHQAAESPYRASGPIFVRVNQPAANLAPREIPPMLCSRLRSVRGYSDRGWIECADVTEGSDLEAVIARAFENPKIAYLHLHLARPGGYACRVDRVAAG
jgi:hypothetical protein